MRPKPVAVLGLWGALIAAPAFAVQLNVGDLILADERTGTIQPSRILRFDPSTGAHDVISSGGALRSIHSVMLDRSGRIVVVDELAGVIRIDPATGAQAVLSENFFDEGFQFPRGAIELPSGDLIVSTSNRHLLRIDATSGEKTILTQSSAPIGRMAWHDGSILITSASFTSPALLRFDPATWTSTVVSSGGFFSSPQDIAITAGGYAYIADLGGILVGVDPVTGMQTSASAGGPLNSLFAVTIGGNGRPIVTTGGGQIFEIDPDNFGEQILLTAPGENLGTLRAIEYVTNIPSPASIAAFSAAGIGLFLRRRRDELPPGTARLASTPPERACRRPRTGERVEGVSA